MTEKYPFLMRVYHWSVGVLIISLITAGWIMTELNNDVSYKYDIYKWHKAFGVVALILVLLRIYNRLKSDLPSYPKGINKTAYKFAKIVHYLMYMVILLIPIAGYLMSSAADRPVWFFGITLPNIISKNGDLAKFFNSSHYYLAYTLLTLLTLHILGTVKHYLIDKKNLLKRII